MANNNWPLLCPQGIDAVHLSNWRDGGLSPLEAQRIEAHVGECAACRRVLADYDTVALALRSQPELEPSERILLGVQSRAATPVGGQWARLDRRQILSGLGSLAAVLVLAGLFAALLGTHPSTALKGRVTETASSATPTSFPATPSPTPNIFSPSVSYQAAWGATAVTATYSMTLDSTHTFVPTSLSVDGSMLLGTEAVSTGNPPEFSSYRAGFYDLSTRRFTAIGVGDYGDPVACCQSDGRFLVARDSTNPEATGSYQYFRFWAYDLQTGHLRLVVTARQVGGALYDGVLSHGLLVLATYNGLQVADLAAGTITPLHLPLAPGSGVGTFDWPYLIYDATTATGQPSTTRLYNFETNQNTPFTALQSFVASLGESAAQIGYTIAGDSFYVSVLTGQNPDDPSSGVTALYELEHALSGGTKHRMLATFNGDQGYLEGANARVIVCTSAVWDTSLHTFVTFPVFTGNNNVGFSIDLAGNTLAVAQGNGAVDTVLIFDTARLTSTGG